MSGFAGGPVVKNPPSRMWGRDSLGVQDGQVHTAVFKMDHQQGPTYSTWNSIHCYVVAWMGGDLGEDGSMCTYG